jgi:hypothetical protein
MSFIQMLLFFPRVFVAALILFIKASIGAIRDIVEIIRE